ncbi:MAG: AAA family ATPase [Prevotella sp.]|nr:AAA family ATPase [Prevotella sp.]
MLEWKNNHQDPTALLIQGARRVGKSTLAENFGRNEYESYILIDFAYPHKGVIELFNDLSDLDSFFNQLQFIYKTSLTPGKSVIIFDEVQKCPLARQSIKRLVADGRFDYIETGSLLSIRKNVKDIIIPSEETRINLFPLDFEEFLWATGDSVTYNLLHSAFKTRKPLGQAAHRAIMKTFRLYMLVGGMPQAVLAYLNTKNLQDVDAVKRNIIELYREDFRKIDPSGNLSEMFFSIPEQLGRNVSRYEVGAVINGAKASRMREAIEDMKDSYTVMVCRHSNDPNVGFNLHSNSDKFKLYICDTGLFITMAFWDKSYTDNEIYERLLLDKLSADLGYVFENMVAQMLKSSGHELFYYTWPTPDKKKNFEIDFLISRKNKICPIEVKSSGYNTHKSLDEFIKKFSSRIAQSYLIYTKDLSRDNNIDCVPTYMTPFL